MSFAEARIEEYLMSKACKGEERTEVPFAKTKVGNLEIVIVATAGQLPEHRDSFEEEIERRLAEQGHIRLPEANKPAKRKFQRIDVAGEPISEMIINERR